MGGITCDSVRLTAKHSTNWCVVVKRPQRAGTTFSLSATREGGFYIPCVWPLETSIAAPQNSGRLFPEFEGAGATH
jgi:hypothetical protein